MNLQSPKVTVEKSAQYIFESLSDVKNFEKLMPENIAKFEVTGDDSFIFALKKEKICLKNIGPILLLVFS